MLSKFEYDGELNPKFSWWLCLASGINQSVWRYDVATIRPSQFHGVLVPVVLG